MSPRSVTRSLAWIVAGWALLAALFARYDLPISIAFYDPSSPWGIFVQRFGELPGLAVIGWALLILGVEALRAGRPDATAMGIGALLLLAATLFYGLLVLMPAPGVAPQRVSGQTTLLWILALLAAGAAGVVCLQRAPTFTPAMRAFAHRSLRLGLLNAILFVQTAKVFWGRIRFRDLDPATWAGFTPWYVPRGPTGHYSFPSGHAALGWMLLPLLVLVAERPRWMKVSVWVLIIAWGLFVAVGRVRIGAHYASDVLFPTTLALLIHFHRPAVSR